MATLGKKILMVDADPQCNLTGLTLGLRDPDELHNFYESKQNADIFYCLAPKFALNAQRSPSDARITATPTKNKNLFILPGNIHLSEIDNQIATSLTSSNTIPKIRDFVGAFNNLIRVIAQEHSFDYVIVDMGPSVSATNQSILMSSDYFIVPISPDFFCYQAISALSQFLPKWAKQLSEFKNTDKTLLPSKNPQMLGFITQNYRIYTTDKHTSDSAGEGASTHHKQKQMSKAYRVWLEKIQDLAKNNFVPELKKEKMVISDVLFSEYVRYDDPYHLAGVQDFNALIPVSQKLSKPIFELTDKDGEWRGAAWHNIAPDGKEQGVKKNIEEAEMIYKNLAISIINMIEADSIQ